MIRFNGIRWALVPVLAVCGAASVNASPLAAGTSNLPVAGEQDPMGTGLTLLHTSQIPFVAENSFTGTLTTKVYSGDSNNPWFGTGGLTFTYQIQNNSDSPHAVGRLSLQGFGGAQIDASYQVDSLGNPLPPGSVAPIIADRSEGVGDSIGFFFFALPLEDPNSGALAPGGSSSILVLQTDSNTWNPSTASLINSGTVTIGSLAPNVVPEPATMGLLALGAVGLLARRRR